MIVIATGSIKGTGLTPAGVPESVTIEERVRVFRVSDGATVASFAEPADPVFHLAWSPDGRFVAFDDDGPCSYWQPCLVHLWNPSAPGAVGQLPLGRDIALSVAFSPDGSRLAVANGPVKIFEIKE
jgi:WD40 repeat protein